MQVEVEFKRMFAHAIGLYPNAKESEANWAAYWGFLSRYPVPVLRGAFRRACLSSPEFFPSAVRVRECAEAESKTVLSLPPPERKALPTGKREYVPPVGAGAEEWINEAPNKFERLGRVWACESKLRGIHPEAEAPQEIGRRRLKEFWALWNQETTSGPPQTGSGSASAPNGSSASRQSAGSSPAQRPSHGVGCVCEECMPAVMGEAARMGLI